MTKFILRIKIPAFLLLLSSVLFPELIVLTNDTVIDDVITGRGETSLMLSNAGELPKDAVSQVLYVDGLERVRLKSDGEKIRGLKVTENSNFTEFIFTNRFVKLPAESIKYLPLEPPDILSLSPLISLSLLFPVGELKDQYKLYPELEFIYLSLFPVFVFSQTVGMVIGPDRLDGFYTTSLLYGQIRLKQTFLPQVYGGVGFHIVMNTINGVTGIGLGANFRAKLGWSFLRNRIKADFLFNYILVRGPDLVSLGPSLSFIF